ncbi:MAG: putative hydrolase [Proteobacteria bacterium]|jgi:glyoxylase-like metal-dependent hydrolase (beta-lactamase superfamily II)|nr:putative hydrolase [Pseudomonadota bacterium]
MAGTLPRFAQALGDGIWCIDTGYHRPHYDAAYLLVDSGRAAFFDTGTNHAVPRLLATLDALGLARDAVDWVIPSHVHLDHAGGAGLLMRELPSARMLLHPRGLRHLVDPSALQQAVLDIYGPEAVARDYGTLVPVQAERITPTEEGMAVHLGTRRLEFAHTPGHAQHHHCLWDEASGGWFAGDTFGISYREFDSARGPWILAISTPVQFDPPALQASVRRLLAKQPRCMHLTHYGRVGDVARLGAELIAGIDRLVTLGLSTPGGTGRDERLRRALQALYEQDARAHGCTQGDAAVADALAMDLRLNAQGLGLWLDRQGR